MVRPLKFKLKLGMQELKVEGGEPYGRPTIAFQGNGGIEDLRMWVTVMNPAWSRNPEWLLYVAITGEQLPDGYWYEPLGTAMTPDFSYVVHLYRMDKKPE